MSEEAAKRCRGAQKGNNNSHTHGITVLKRVVNGLGHRVIDRRTVLGKELGKWRRNLIQDLGGEQMITTQQRAVVDLCVKSKLILDSIDAWLLTQPSLVNGRKKALLPAVRERQALADGLARYLAQLGLERKTQTRDLGAAVRSRL